MSNSQPFHQRFNIKIDLEEARQRFVSRVYNEIFDGIFDNTLYMGHRYEAKRLVATRLGKKSYTHHDFVDYIGSDFIKCLEAIEALYGGLGHTTIPDRIENVVRKLIWMSEHDLGIKWEKGYFVPTGAKLLDDILVNENLKWLEGPELKHVHDPFNKGLLHYSESVKNSEKLSDVVTDMHEALEATAKWFLKNGKDLSGNQQEFISRLCLPQSYGRMLKEYIDYANQLARHAKNPEKPSYKIPPSEAESFIYLTGLFIRYAIKKSEENK